MWVGGFEIAECTEGLLGRPKMGEIEMGREPEEANTKGLRTVYPPAGAREKIGILIGSSGCSQDKNVCFFG